MRCQQVKRRFSNIISIKPHLNTSNAVNEIKASCLCCVQCCLILNSNAVLMKVCLTVHSFELFTQCMFVFLEDSLTCSHFVCISFPDFTFEYIQREGLRDPIIFRTTDDLGIQ